MPTLYLSILHRSCTVLPCNPLVPTELQHHHTTPAFLPSNRQFKQQPINQSNLAKGLRGQVTLPTLSVQMTLHTFCLPGHHQTNSNRKLPYRSTPTRLMATQNPQHTTRLIELRTTAGCHLTFWCQQQTVVNSGGNTPSCVPTTTRKQTEDPMRLDVHKAATSRRCVNVPKQVTVHVLQTCTEAQQP
jgi:hypothetical protein